MEKLLGKTTVMEKLLLLAVLLGPAVSTEFKANPDLEAITEFQNIDGIERQPATGGYLHKVAITPFYQPRHVHLAYGATTTSVVVTWSTLAMTGTPRVEWGTDPFRLSATAHGHSKKFVDSPGGGSVQWIHRVHLGPLTPNTTYYYHCGGIFGWSGVFAFRTYAGADLHGTEAELRLAVFGDLGVVNARSITRLQEEAHQGRYDAVLHVGDFAYDMNKEAGAVGDAFMEQIQPIAAYLPYMTCPGNHENADDFHQYRARFSMPGYNATQSLYHSFDIGPVHFVAVSTEVYYYGPNILLRVMKQYQWLKQDLEWASAPANRTLRPWILLFGHRPMYCSTGDKDDCTKVHCKTRVGIFGMYGLEPLLVKYGVDLAIWAHEHAYERIYPVYNYTVYKDSPDPYFNPKAPVHITTGAAGCLENLDPWMPDQPAFSAKRVGQYGYSRLQVKNATHLMLQQVHDKDGAISDSFTLVRETHDHYPYLH